MFFLFAVAFRLRKVPVKVNVRNPNMMCHVVDSIEMRDGRHTETLRTTSDSLQLLESVVLWSHK